MFTKLLVPLDRSALAEQAIGRATAIARASNGSIDLVLVHQPIPFAGFNDAPWDDQQWSDEHAYLESIATEVASGSGGAVPTTHAVVKGEVVDMICRRAWDVGADLIVMTSHGRTGMSRAWMGSIADGVLRHSSVPVLMLQPVEGKKRLAASRHLFKKILVPLDGSEMSGAILSAAASLAHSSGAKVTLLRVVEPVPLISPEAGVPFAYMPELLGDEATQRLADDAKTYIDGAVKTFQAQGGGEVDAQVLVAPHAARAILDFARGHEIEAIAMTTRGRGASRLFMGSVADKILRASGVPMLLYRPMAAVEKPGMLETAREVEAPAMARGK